MTHRRSVLAVVLLTAALGLPACSGTGSTTSAATSDSTSGTSPASTPSTSSSTGSSTGSARASGECTSIDQPAAANILGSPTKAGLSSHTTGLAVGGMTKTDGCTYKSTSAGSLGYTVLRGNVKFAQTMIGSVKARMTKQSSKPGSAVVLFDAGLPNSVSFTQHFGGGVDSQITVLANDSLISVAVARKDGNVAKAQASAKAAAKQLVAGA